MNLELRLGPLQIAQVTMVAIIVLALMPILGYATLPETRTDALNMHLNIAKSIVEDGRIERSQETPQVLDQGIGMSILAFPYWFLSDLPLTPLIVPKLLNFAALTLLLASIMSRRAHVTARLFAVMLLVSTPVVQWVSATSYADIIPTFLFVLGVMSLREKEALAPFLLGASMLFKFQYWFAAALVMGCNGVYSLLTRKKSLQHILRANLVLALILLFMVLPLLLKNVLLSGTPLPYSPLTPLQIVANSSPSVVLLGRDKSWKNMLLVPFDTFTTAQDNAYGGILHPLWLLIFLLCLMWYSKHRQGWELSIMLASLVYALFWEQSGVQDVRYLLPFLALFAVFATAFWHKVPPSLQLLGIVGCLISLPYWTYRYPYTVRPVPAAPDVWVRTDALHHFMAASIPAYRDVLYINSHLQATDKILLVKEPHLVYFDPPVVQLFTPPLETISLAPTTTAALQALRDGGFTHVYVPKYHNVPSHNYASLANESWIAALNLQADLPSGRLYQVPQ